MRIPEVVAYEYLRNLQLTSWSWNTESESILSNFETVSREFT